MKRRKKDIYQSSSEDSVSSSSVNIGKLIKQEYKRRDSEVHSVPDLRSAPTGVFDIDAIRERNRTLELELELERERNKGRQFSSTSTSSAFHNKH